MANFFDQFDQQPAAAAPAAAPSSSPAPDGNFFDQFDQQPAAVAPAPAQDAPAVTAPSNIIDSTIKMAKAVPSQIVPGVIKAAPHAVESTLDLAAGAVMPTELGRGDDQPSFAQDQALSQFMQSKYGAPDPKLPNGYAPEQRRQGYQDFIAQGGQSSLNVPHDPSFGQRIGQGLTAAHLNPDDYFPAPATPEERAAEAGVEGATLMLAPGGQEAGLARLGKVAAELGTGFAGGAAGQAAYEAAPEDYKVPASLAAGFIGGAGVAGASKAVGAVARRGADYLAPAFGDPNKIAAARLASVTTDRDAALAGLENPPELVPGSKPTALQATGDVGIGSLERAMARSDQGFKGDLLGRLDEQSAARLASLESLQDSGHPAAVADYFRTRMADLESKADQLYADAQNRAQKAAGDLGTPSATQTGETARSAILTNLKGLNDEASHLWNSIDPDGKLSVLTNPLVRSTARIYGMMSPEQKLSLSPSEKALAGIIGSYPETIPFARFKDLRSEISRAMREAKSYQSPNDMAYGRLAQLRSAVEEAVSDSIAGKVSAEQQAVRTGQMSEEDTLAANFLRQAKEWYADREAQARLGAPASNAVPAAGGSPAVSRPHGAASQTGGESTGAQGLEGLPRNADIPDRGDVGDQYEQQPHSNGRGAGEPGAAPAGAGNARVASRQPATELAQEAPRLIDPAAAQRFKAATTATKNIKEIFGTKPIKDIVHRPGATMPFTKTPEWVSGAIWKPGPEGSAIIQKVLKAGGNRAEARQAVNDAAVLSMRSAALKDGIIDPAKLEAWRAKHASALSEVPDLDRRLRGASQATKAMVDAGERRAAALKAAQQGAISKVMQLGNDADVSNALGTIIGGKGSVQAMRDLVSQASNDPGAIAGLRRGVVDHLFNRFRTPKDSISAHQFQQYINKVSPALEEVFTPEQMGALRNIAADLRRATKDVRAPGGGSDTKENFNNQSLIAAPTRGASLINHIVSDIGVGTLAAALMHPLSGLAWSAFSGIGAAAGAHILQSMREAGLGRVDDLIKEALLNPELARVLLKSAPITNRVGWRRALMRALSKITLQQGVQTETRERPKKAA